MQPKISHLEAGDDILSGREWKPIHIDNTPPEIAPHGVEHLLYINGEEVSEKSLQKLFLDHQRASRSKQNEEEDSQDDLGSRKNSNAPR